MTAFDGIMAGTTHQLIYRLDAERAYTLSSFAARTVLAEKRVGLQY